MFVPSACVVAARPPADELPTPVLFGVYSLWQSVSFAYLASIFCLKKGRVFFYFLWYILISSRRKLLGPIPSIVLEQNKIGIKSDLSTA